MFKYSYIVALLAILGPQISLAADSTGSLQTLLTGLIGFINVTLIPFVLVIAFLIFVVNVIRFFVIGGASADGQENARNLALYSIAAFVFILVFWGIVELLVNGIGLGNPTLPSQIPASDYMPQNYIPSDCIDNHGNPC